MPTNAGASQNFIALKGENCKLMKIRGVQELRDEYGTDLLAMIRNGGGTGGGATSSDVEATLANLLSRLDAVENYLQNTNVQGTPGPKGDRGDKGETGENGRDGLDGARGPRGKVEKLRDVEDVDLNGLADGAILVWSAEDKKWVVSLEEE